MTPTGDIEALALRGAWTGNRGILHSDDGEIVRLHAHPHWLTCALRFKDRRHEQWQPHHFTWPQLPTGAFVLTAEGTPAVVLDDSLVTWTHHGYHERMPRPVRGTAPTVTPSASVAALRAGYPVQIDAGAQAAADS